MERGVEIFAAVNLLVIGVSHIAMPRAWAELFVRLREWGDPGAFVGGFMALTMGSIVVAFHNVWTGLPAVLTVIGWLWVLKAFLVFCIPGFGVWSLRSVSVERPGGFRVAGAGLLLLAGLMGFVVFTGGAS